MGFFSNMKNLKDQFIENEKIQDIEQLQGIFDIIDNQAEKEQIKSKKEREYFNSLNRAQKIEYQRLKRRNRNLRRLGLYGLSAASLATGVGIPVLIAANVGTILSDDSLTFNKEEHDAKLSRGSNRNQHPLSKNKANDRTYFTIEYDSLGEPIVKTLVDKDPYDLDFRYEEIIVDR